jgi:signal transduction histidine kinase
MRSLRTRIVILSVLIALGSALICAIAAVIVAQRNIMVIEDRQANDATTSMQRQIDQLLDELSFQVNDYGNWDELYDHMPSPSHEWSRVNLTPGKDRGALAQFFITADRDHITGRFHDGDVRGPNASVADSAPASALVQLLGQSQPAKGLGIFDGHPALYAVTPVRRSERKGDSRGELIALAYVTNDVLMRLKSPDWSLHIEPIKNAGMITVGAPLKHLSTVSERDFQRLTITTLLGTHDGSLRMVLSTNRMASQRISDDMARTIVITGILVAIGAIFVGTWLGWRWVAPISALTTACRDHMHDVQRALPKNSGLLEADILSENLQELVTRLHLGQEELAHALDRETTTNVIHRRFLAQLSQEFGQPIRQTIALCERIARQSGRLDPEEVTSAKRLASALERQFQEILSIIDSGTAHVAGERSLSMEHYLKELAELLWPSADKAGVTICVEASTEEAFFNPELLSPALINLCANAIKASRRGDTVWLQGTIDRSRSLSVWTVKDHGHGLPSALADRMRDVFAAGEVMPGTTGIGMGLTVAVTNVRAMGGTLSLATSPTATAKQGVTIIIRLPFDEGQGHSDSASERIRRRTQLLPIKTFR